MSMKERGVLAWVGLQLGDSAAPDWPPWPLGFWGHQKDPWEEIILSEVVTFSP